MGFPKSRSICGVTSTKTSSSPTLQGSVTFHCGPFVQQGPALVDLRRREVLDPYGSLKFHLPKGGWVELDRRMGSRN